MAKKLSDRFWSKVQKNEGDNACWTWTGCLGNGYGFIIVKENGEWKRRKASRISWELTHHRKIPKDKCVCHHCDNPTCVRPSHLYLGDKGTNMRDCVRRERNVPQRGEKSHRAKLTWSEIHQIRSLWEADKWSQRKLAAKFNVSRRNIRAILENKSWLPEWEPRKGKHDGSS